MKLKSTAFLMHLCFHAMLHYIISPLSVLVTFAGWDEGIKKVKFKFIFHILQLLLVITFTDILSSILAFY